MKRRAAGRLSMRDIVLIKVSGRDRPGLTAALATILGRYGINVLDIGQAVIHNNLAWGMLVEIPPEAAAAPVFRELMFKAHELDLDLRIVPVSEEDYREWVGEGGQNRHVITVLGRQFKADHIARVAELITHLRDKHGREPGVAEALMSIFMRLGMVGPDGRVRIPIDDAAAAAPAIVVPGATAEPGKLWTPDSVAQAAKKSALWVPE